MNPEDHMQAILERLLEEDITITFREVARLHPTLDAATSITRHPQRRAMVEHFIDRQGVLRKWRDRTSKRSKTNLARELSKRDQMITELNQEIALLRASHMAMLRAITEMGGHKRWVEFFPEFENIRKTLRLGEPPDISLVQTHKDGDQ